MRYNHLIAFLVSISILLDTSCTIIKVSQPVAYRPDNQKLYDTIVHLDSLFFEAYNTCNIHLQEYSSFYGDSIEFYHDKGGAMTSKAAVIEATQKYICGKVTRKIVQGSIEVYPISGYGAVEMGLHQFYNIEDKPDAPHPSGKFIILWQFKNNQWKIKRIISLH